LYARTGRALVESLRHPTTVTSSGSPFHVQPRSVQQAIAEALENEDKEYAQTRWSDSVSSAEQSRGSKRAGNRLLDSRSATVDADAAHAFQPIQRIGGATGWFYADWLWRLRGFLDLLVGGAGMRRGRRHPVDLRVGDVIDWWRVEAFEPGRYLRLVAEMRLPGRAWIEFTVEPQGGSSLVTQTAIFDPIGLPGILYWYGIYPLHAFVFKGMLQGIISKVQMVNSQIEKGAGRTP
jgi:hypothetical protein